MMALDFGVEQLLISHGLVPDHGTTAGSDSTVAWLPSAVGICGSALLIFLLSC